MRIAYVLYPGFTALDLIGPYEVISRWPDATFRFVATSPDPVTTDLGMSVLPTATTADVGPVDMIVVPGGGGTASLDAARDAELIGWITRAAPDAGWLVSVCSGSVLYATAGLLRGRRATTHWAMRENVRALGADVVPERVVFDGNVVSGAGVSAGIDMALALTARVHGEDTAKALQLVIEYDPEPPFDSGSPDKAAASTLRLASRMLLGDAPLRAAARVTGHLVAARFRRPPRTGASGPSGGRGGVRGGGGGAG
ncbi:DJ-1/PfpI family protein [Actinocorallia sp. API 0066]|uniref:DJ-1/PfpI family protein n=1 Tax=Actinocorallia sp. API 0066 TaxID=2896846 RepID=UPI001E426D49|nr:DJ-1/PfpI family protein [Actinocorallia sp. API 0066]MCD0448624.1 DJ-1/PfpI family protein [Actinocorallia sp. API 0066]